MTDSPNASSSSSAAGGPRRPRRGLADVALLLEGTYPFVQGGVSSWVHAIIRGLPQLDFAIMYLGATRSQHGEMKYELPPNVVHLETEFIMDVGTFLPPVKRGGKKGAFDAIPKLIESFKGPAAGFDSKLLAGLLRRLGTADGIEVEDFHHHPEAWELIRDAFRRYSTDPSFIDYFWTVRTMHRPLFKLAALARRLPPARLYHSISTGYAGFLGMMMKMLTGRPYILTEHGIYTKERKIDLGQADWIRDPRESFSSPLDGDIGHLRKLWIRFFEGIGRLTYSAADPIIALYDGNRQRQVRDGAPAARTRVIPNGIDVQRFSKLRAPPLGRIPPILGLIGRVVPIKDVKTFVRTVRCLAARLPDVEGWIVGPETEDPQYARECRGLVESLELGHRVKFLGFQKVEHILPRLGLLTLTSISEALPLVVLEGFAAGLPALTTDVGCCRELIEGRTAEDRAIGAAGAVASIADPDGLAEAAVRLLGDPQRWQQARLAAIRRVESYYTLESMIDNYLGIYSEALKRPWQALASSCVGS
jgi:glycosyltransferase involved in cell wall biosynthesis